MNVFSERLSKLKEESGLMLKDLSLELDISIPNLSYYMKGREPNYATLCKLADHFNVTTDYLVGCKPKNDVDNLIIELNELKFKYSDIQEENKKLKSLLYEINKVSGRGM